MKMKKMLMNNRGASTIIFGVAMITLIGFSSLVTDIGMVTLQKSKLSNAVDAATLAAARELVHNPGNEYNAARELMDMNGYTGIPIDLDLEDNGHSVRITASDEVKHLLARVIDRESTNISVTAKGKVLPIIGINNGIRPFAIEDQDLTFDTTYTLKEGGGDGTTGNYGAIALSGSGANVYYNNIVNGYNGRLTIGDYIDTEPGNMSGPTERGVDTLIDNCNHYPACTAFVHHPECPRLVTIVVVDTLDVAGRSTVQIVGFASFFLESVEGSGNESIVTGKFIQTVTVGDMDEANLEQDYGLFGVKLVE